MSDQLAAQIAKTTSVTGILYSPAIINDLKTRTQTLYAAIDSQKDIPRAFDQWAVAAHVLIPHLDEIGYTATAPAYIQKAFNANSFSAPFLPGSVV